MTRSLRCVVSGKVQGVFFRAWVLFTAMNLGLCGFVRNRSAGQVETLAQGPEEALAQFARCLRQGPPLARVEDVAETWLDDEPAHEGFRILR